MINRAFWAAAIFPVVFMACPPLAAAETILLKADMTGDREVPPNLTQGSGRITVMIDTATKTATYTITYAGLSGGAIAAHLHGPAISGTNAPLVTPIPIGPSPLKGTFVLTEAQMDDMLAGLDYINIHTKHSPSGEIRGYLK